jgi:hypothetical protein
VTPPPGPLGDEAARLVEALAQWARSGLGDLPLATDSAECKVCPVCQLIAALRHAKPETFAHLADASSSVAAAVRSVLETGGKPGGPGSVQRIDLDEPDGAASASSGREGAG